MNTMHVPSRTVVFVVAPLAALVAFVWIKSATNYEHASGDAVSHPESAAENPDASGADLLHGPREWDATLPDDLQQLAPGPLAVSEADSP